MKSTKHILIAALFFLTISKTVVGQQSTSCGYPIHVSADSLVNFVINDMKNKTGLEIGMSDEEWKEYFYDNTKGIKYDSAFNKCQDYLIQRLGKSVYCNYIDMYLNSFTMLPNGFELSFGLQLPNLIHRQRIGYMDCNYERINIVFKMHLQSDSTLSITYPTNVPNCNGLPDCGFIITKDIAIAIAKKSGFLNDTSKYYIGVDGINWEITTEEVYGVIKSIKINLQTGEQSSVQTAIRI
jgi:hypothetical protein